jgi:hypothetical protein
MSDKLHPYDMIHSLVMDEHRNNIVDYQTECTMSRIKHDAQEFICDRCCECDDQQDIDVCTQRMKPFKWLTCP